eukprot:Nk52_evm4s1400 gene=Nk52_evmTU4s1400
MPRYSHCISFFCAVLIACQVAFASESDSETANTLPSSSEAHTASLANIFSAYAANGVITEERLADLLVKVGYKNDEHEGHSHGDGDNGHEEEGHEHDDDDDDHSKVLLRRATLGVCYSVDDLLAIFDNDSSDSLNQTEFETMLPTVVDGIENGVCRVEETCVPEHLSKNAAYGWSFLAVAIITALSVMGIVFFPFLRESSHAAKMTFNCIMSLGVGTMFGDAILHLLPGAWGIHSHEDDCHTHDHSGEGGDEFDFLWKGAFALVGFQFLFILEKAIHVGLEMAGKGRIQATHQCTHSEPGSPPNELEVEETDADKARPPKESIEHQDEGEQRDLEYDLPKNANAKMGGSSVNVIPFFYRVKPLAWMILLGDGMHNFIDGIAIGASFATSTELGISTSIAVGLHEIPQELSDYVILINSGFGKYAAMLANLLSAAGAFVGIILGIELSGSYKPWLLAFAAGNFIYLALVDLLPEIFRIENSQRTIRGKAVMFSLSQFFIMLGYTAMLLLGRYGENL